MFLIYDHMEIGSLFFVLSNDVKAMELDWMKGMLKWAVCGLNTKPNSFF